MAGSTPPRKRAQPKTAPRPAEAAPEADGDAAKLAAAVATVASLDARPLEQWLADVAAEPKKITAFGRVWEFKQPTGKNTVRWDELLGDETQGIRPALASMALDETPADGDGQPPGSKLADEFLIAATAAVPRSAMVEFWARFQVELFGLGEA